MKFEIVVIGTEGGGVDDKGRKCYPLSGTDSLNLWCQKYSVQGEGRAQRKLALSCFGETVVIKSM